MNFKIHWDDLPPKVRYLLFSSNFEDIDSILAPFHGEYNIGYNNFEFESEAHYHWFLIKFS